jgi:phosphopantetheine--protein transferase-like protein
MVGIDIVELEDARHLLLPAMRARLLAPGELARLGRSGGDPSPVLEAFALKEAVLKALGWGIDRGVGRFAEIEHVPGRNVRLHGEVAREARRRGGELVAVTVPVGTGVMAVARICHGDARAAADELLRSARAATAVLEKRHG